MRALLCWRSDRLPILQIPDLTGSESLEGRLGPPPDVWAEKLRGLLLGAELVGHKFLVEQPQAAAFRRWSVPPSKRNMSVSSQGPCGDTQSTHSSLPTLRVRPSSSRTSR